jgi:1,4-dihydroxy-2-naphthoyl-CoA synthase
MLGSHFRGTITGSFDTGYFATVIMEERGSREYRCVVYSPALASPRSRAPGESPTRPPLPAYCVPAVDDSDVQNVVYTRNDGTHAFVRARDAWGRSYAAGYRRRSNSPEFRESSLEPID